ncbi:hypothetical protein ATC00_09770 [Sinorhizobium americanum]|nr:hypothetical protein ATC00_09770 [Sinorhizobium americanum]
MKLDELLKELENATGPSRALDAAIGKIVGYKRKVEYRRSSQTGEPVRKVFWVVPSGEDYVRMPAFTGLLDAAIDLATTIVVGCRGGVSYVDGTATARINNGPYFFGATPALAICIAALSTRLDSDD